jgi:preprotein translocase subunit SecA
MLAPVYRSLGCSVGLLPENASTERKRAAYACDITYGTGYEFGFDYLREQTALLARRRARLGDRYWSLLHGKQIESPALGAQRGFALVDEIDSVLIDEACTPLVLSESGAAEAVAAAAYEHALGVAQRLVAGRDFIFEGPKGNRIKLTEDGRRLCYQALSGEPREFLGGPWSDQVRQALVALYVLKRDVDYVVTSAKVVFVDGDTGRLSPDRAWRDGLQQFLEIKEGVPLSAERSTAARMTRQSFFRLYDTLSGMTATAVESEAEFRGTYQLRIADIPPRLPSRRLALPDRVFVDNQARLRAVAMEIDRLHQTGRPILVGCRTIERSEQIAARLTGAKIAHELLNGKQTAAEADVIARAGRRGAVTIATNMAGRGTDIKLQPGVAEIGGMHLIAIERNESPRVDRQLVGRVARQGDPGSCQFFVAADDPLVERFAPALAVRIRQLPGDQGEVPGNFSRMIRAAQRRAELASRRVRKELAAADTWLRSELRLS